MKRPKIKDYYDASAGPTFEYNADSYFNDLEKYCDCIEKQKAKALWALHELMGDKGIYIELGYEELYFPTFEELRKWIEDR